MLNDDTLSLITAAVDGELTPGEARRLVRLLDASAEARQLYAQLKSDSERLRTQRPVLAPVGLFQRIMSKVAAVRPPVQPRSMEPRRQPGPQMENRWVALAVAACVLLGISVGSFLFFTRETASPRPMARGGTAIPANRKPASEGEWSKWLPPDNGPRPSVPVPIERERHGPTLADGHATPRLPDPRPIDSVAVAPEPRPSRGDPLGSPLRPETSFDLAQARVPFLRPLAELELEDVRAVFAEELTRDPAFRIDLFTRDPGRAVQFLQSAARSSGVNLLVDATTLDRLKRQQVSAVVVYTESLTATELAGLFGKLAAEDTTISPRVFDLLHVTQVLKSDQDLLRDVLGFDPGLFKRPAAEKGSRNEKNSDPTKPLSAGTADHLVKTLATAGQGKSPEKSAILLTLVPNTSRTAPLLSHELKQFVSTRTERKSNAVPVMIVIR